MSKMPRASFFSLAPRVGRAPLLPIYYTSIGEAEIAVAGGRGGGKGGITQPVHCMQ
jgi:hypothetical protein